ncbi:hypothetical protein H0H92_013573 [Tricholoma furcatifolium]|nr:hypothetical protein H0H92_013573 [Tricholoma furcatifolium]
MATAVLQSNKVPVSKPFRRTSRPAVASANSHASSSRPPPPGDVSDASTTSMDIPSTQSSTKGFARIRSSLEQSLRTATRSKKVQPPIDDDFATITARQVQGREETISASRKERDRTGMFRKLESKVTFRRIGRQTPSPQPPVPVDRDPNDDGRLAGFTSFVAPSMRQGSMSSPSLHLSSQAIPSPKSRPAIPVSSLSNGEIHATPTRDRVRQSTQPLDRDTSTQTRRHGALEQIPTDSNRTPVSRQRSKKPPPFEGAPSSPSAGRGFGSDSGSASPETPTPTRRDNDLPSPPTSPTPISTSGQLNRTTSRKGSASSSHLPLTTPPSSPTSPRALSPSRSRPPRVVTPRGLASTSASHLPMSPSSPRRPSIDSPRRPSVDAPRRISGEMRLPSVESPRRASIDTTHSRLDSPSRAEEDLPAPRPRPVSPGQRQYMQNRHFNISSASIVSGPPNPEFRELIRTASSMLCKEIIKIPPHMNKTEAGIRDWEEVEVRTRALARAERIWGRNGSYAMNSSSNVNSVGGSTMSASAEERERRLFADALRDGYVLCQFLNKLRSASVVKPDARDDGIVRLSNITKFLAACSSYGLPEEDLFQHDDLIEATGESLAHVARTIIALVKFADAPSVDRSKIIHGQGKKPVPIVTPGPYQQESPSSRAIASTPNLFHPSSPPAPTSPTKKRHSPPGGIPMEASENTEKTIRGSSTSIAARNETPPTGLEKQVSRAPIMTPPPRSPLRAKSVKSQRNDETELSTWAKTAASPTRTPAGDAAIVDDPRQSVASFAVTETTVTTEISSILDFRRSSNGNNKYGTIRTVTTDLTSEAPSMTRTEGSAIAEELTRRKSIDCGPAYHRDRKLSEVPLVDRVIEEDDGGSSSSRGREKSKAADSSKALSKPEKLHALHLRKGKWPDDFMDVFQAHSHPRVLTPKSSTPEVEDDLQGTAPVSVSPPRKMAVIGVSRRNESVEALPQFPRRPTHRARQSSDAPILAPRDSILGRDGSPDGISGMGGPRVMLRRHSTKPGMPGNPKNVVHFARNEDSEPHDFDNSQVPFPRAASTEPSGVPSSPPKVEDKPRLARGRFQSDNDSSSQRRTRPNSYDELGHKPMRTRIESMVNLGAGSANTSASDLLSRDSVDGSALRKTLIVREEGKPATHFQLGNCVGRGQFGSVYRALNLNTGQMVAVKRIRLEGLKESEITTLMREVDLVKRLSHPSIVKYEGMARDADTLNIVLEYAENGSLGQTLKAFGKFNERLVASYVVKILEGLHYLHESDVVHCDLKAANILTTKNGNVKLSDFGVSLNLRAMEREMKDVAGTPNWMAPEVIELKGASTKSDIWSLACTVIELLTGRPPYAEVANPMTVMYSIVEDDMPPLPPSCSPLLCDFLTACFNKDPKKRPSAMMLFEHPWLKQNWGIHKELRPQDSIPFLRRVSADLQKSEFVRYLAQLDAPEPVSESPRDKSSPLRPRISDVSMRPNFIVDNDISPKGHEFVKTSFSKPMVCRVCLSSVKKSAVLCAQCSLIAHSKCASDAPPTCDLRSQLLLYAKYAEKGHQSSVYSNPAEGLHNAAKPASDVPYIAHSRASVDTPTPAPTPIPPNPDHPPISYKFMGFKRSRQNLSPEPASRGVAILAPSGPSSRKALRTSTKSAKGRPHSLSSNSTEPNSLSSAATAAESLASRHDRRAAIGSDAETQQLSVQSNAAKSQNGLDNVSAEHHDANYGIIPGSLPVEHRRVNKKEKSSGCIVQ